MTIKINRTGIFLLGTLIIYIFYLQDRLKIVLAGTIAPAEIVSVDDVNEGWTKHFSHGTCARFDHPLMGTLYADNTDKDLQIGDKINVIYMDRSPGMAYIYTFSNFWAFGLLMTIIPMVLWIAFALGYVNPNKVIIYKIPLN